MPQRINASLILVVVGAVALFVSLFLNWYEPRFAGEPALSGWNAFELLDILLAALALVAIAAVVPIPRGPAPATLVASRWLPWFGLAAVVLVVVSLLNDPPGARDRGLDVGAWIGLAGAMVLALGAMLSYARVSLVVSMGPRDSRDTATTRTFNPSES
jgi:hypothetical protein